MDRRTPYEPGDVVLITTGDSTRQAVVSLLIETQALDDSRRWRLLCRWPDRADESVGLPLYCGDDGYGQHVRPVGADAITG